MEENKAEQMGRAGASVAEEIGYKAGYKQGVKDVISEVSSWLDEDTITALEEQFGLEPDEE